MTQSVRAIAADIVAREGGFVNDPDDPGGATNFGVTIHTMRRLGLDLDNDGDIDVADVRALTEDEAIDIFVDHYFNQPRISMLPDELHATLFDMYVNAGGNAVKILQRMLSELGHRVTIDGAIGPQTAGAAFKALADVDSLADLYGVARRSYYYRIADNRPRSRKYARRRDGGKGGWIKRAEEFISPRFHLSDEEHRARTAAWV